MVLDDPFLDFPILKEHTPNFQHSIPANLPLFYPEFLDCGKPEKSWILDIPKPVIIRVDG